MASVLVVLAPGAEEIETVTLPDVLVRAKQEVVVASAGPGLVVTGSRGIPLAAHVLLDAVVERDFDLVYLPGGMGSATTHRDDPRIQRLIARQLASGRWLAVICAAPIALVPLGLAKDREITSYPGVRAQVEPHVRRWVDRPVVQDGNLITSQGPGTALSLGLFVAKLLAGDRVATSVANDLLAPVP